VPHALGADRDHGAQAGDILVVDLLDMGPFQGHEWGYTGIFAKGNGGGFLCDHFPDAAKAIWDLEGIYCSSPHLPGVRFAGLSHPGRPGARPRRSCWPSGTVTIGIPLEIFEKRDHLLPT
jgi:acetamidase/formamidase